MRDNNGQGATAQNVGAKTAVFRAEYQKRYENPKGGITLGKTVHIKTSRVFSAGIM